MRTWLSLVALLGLLSACEGSSPSLEQAGQGGGGGTVDSGTAGQGGTPGTSPVPADSGMAADVPMDVAKSDEGDMRDSSREDTDSSGGLATGGSLGAGGNWVGTGGTFAAGGSTGAGGSSAGTGGARLDGSYGTGGSVTGVDGAPAVDGGAVGVDDAGASDIAMVIDGGSVVADGGAVAARCTLTDSNVCFSNGKAQGLMTGWGWVALAELATITDPTCGPEGRPMAGGNTCSSSLNWNSPNALCVSGTIPALSSPEDPSAYNRNWGIQIGVNSSEPTGTPIGRSYSSITITTTGPPTAGLRAVLHRKGDPSAVIYCADFSSGVPIPFTAFNTNCWDRSNTAFNSTDVPSIDQIAAYVKSTQQEIVLADLCLTEIAFQ